MENGFQKAREAEERMGRTVSDCPFRTQYHIMPPVGWINDPNGLCQFQGEFHAYFQYSPLNVQGGGGYWGHCVSKDMLHWEYRDPVLTTDIPEDAGGVYSGSALIEQDKMYLFYTGNVKKPGDYDYIDAGRSSTQILTESKDGQQMSAKTILLRMEDYPEDMTQHIRDPKVWKENDRYYMVLGARARAWDNQGNRRDKGGILIYVSEDKKNWRLEREIVPEKAFGYMWECPDIFCLGGRRILSFCPQGLETQEEKFQNIYQSGYAFLKEKDFLQTFREWDMGFDFYAPQTFETQEGRRILIGWAGVPDTTEVHKNLSVRNGWQHCLTIPGELFFLNGKLCRMPVRELEALPWERVELKQEKFCWAGKSLKARITGIQGEKRQIRIGKGENALIISTEGNRTEISFLNQEGVPALCGGGRGKRAGRVEGKTEEMLILLDSSIVEIFINQGELVFTTRIYLEMDEREITFKQKEKLELEIIQE